MSNILYLLYTNLQQLLKTHQMVQTVKHLLKLMPATFTSN